MLTGDRDDSQKPEETIAAAGEPQIAKLFQKSWPTLFEVTFEFTSTGTSSKVTPACTVACKYLTRGPNWVNVAL